MWKSFFLFLCASALVPLHAETPPLTLSWDQDMLTIHGNHLPGERLEIHYLEAYCRDGAHDADWVKDTVVPHETTLIDRAANGSQITLECKVSDGLLVKHVITATTDEVRFAITAKNLGNKPSEARWAQPCVRVGEFTGTGKDTTNDAYAYVAKSFLFLDGKLAQMPCKDWATEARYTPGQVWAAPGVPISAVNPRPANPNTPSNGLIGCFSGDGKMLFAMAFEPYHELFQGVIRCLHSDFRLGPLAPGESKDIHGRIYLMENNIDALLKRYEKDFPGQG